MALCRVPRGALKLLLILGMGILLLCVIDLELWPPRGHVTQTTFIQKPAVNSLTFNSVRHSPLLSDPHRYVEQKPASHSRSDHSFTADTRLVVEMNSRKSRPENDDKFPAFSPRYEVSHTPLPEEYVPINDSYFHPRPVIINHLQFGYVSEPQCSRIFLLVLICSTHEHFQYRRAIRDTWGSIGQFQKQVKVLFLLGIHSDSYWNSNILKEASRFNDILVTNVRESYRNLSLKVLSGLNWSRQSCPADYILKSDEDMVVNMPALWRILQQRSRVNTILGSVNYAAPVMRVNKWRVEKRVYPFSVYPPYVSGNSYVITRDAVHRILDTFRYMPLVRVEDAFITGILARASGVTLEPDQRFTFWGTPKISPCDIIKNKMISGTHMTPKSLYVMWKSISKGKC